jgi:hypothetical protein
MCIQIRNTGRKFRENWNFSRTAKTFCENHPGNKNVSRKQKFSRKQNEISRKVSEFLRKLSEFSLIFAFSENEKGDFASTLVTAQNYLHPSTSIFVLCYIRGHYFVWHSRTPALFSNAIITRMNHFMFFHSNLE